MGFMTAKGDVGEKTRQPKVSLKDEIKDAIFNMQREKINKKVLISAPNGTAKSSLSISLLAQDLKDDEVIVYIDVDNSGLEIVQKFYADYYNNQQILVYRPNKTRVRKDGATVRDEKKTIDTIGNAAVAIQEAIDEGVKVKGVIVDGVSFILEYCEAFMRLEEQIGVADGVSIQLWKIRNKAFRDFSSPYMLLPVPVIFVSHEDFIPELEDENAEHKFSSVKQRFIDECSMRITLEKYDNPPVIDYIAEIRKNRSDLTTEGNTYVFLTRNTKTNDIVSDIDDLAAILFPDTNKGKK